MNSSACIRNNEINESEIPIGALYNQTINQIKGNQKLVNFPDMPIELRVTNFHAKYADESKPCYEVSYHTRQHGTTHFHKVYETKQGHRNDQ